MLLNDYLEHFIERVQTGYASALSDLSDDQLHFRTNEQTLQIAFHAWHYFRTKDNICNFALQNRTPTVWMRDNLHEAWGLPKVDQGTGMEMEQARALRVPSVEALAQYGRDVHADVMPFIRSVSEEDLTRITKVNPFGEVQGLYVIGQTLITHGSEHLGQILAMRAIQNLPGDSM